MPSILLNLNVENTPNPARKHFEKTNMTIQTDNNELELISYS